jgi:predicted SAM-dependent methyltransferase
MNARTIIRRGATTASSGAIALRRQVAQRRLVDMSPGSRLHLGCGPNHFDGWVNIDIDPSVHPDVRLDLRLGLPVPRSVATLIYSEHVLEHFTLAEGTKILADCHSALETCGVLRVAMPDLRAVVEDYCGDWRNQTWLQDPAYRMIETPAHMLNYGLREWGHRYLYDYEDLEYRLKRAGFNQVERVSWGESDEPGLRGLEARDDSRLVVEARKV